MPRTYVQRNQLAPEFIKEIDGLKKQVGRLWWMLFALAAFSALLGIGTLLAILG